MREDEKAGKMEKVRSFIALELSDEAREEFARITAVLKRADADVKWVSSGSIHLTLKFLGYISEEKILPVAERLRDLARGKTPFEIILDSIGVFPGWDRARALWIGLGMGSDRVKDLAGEVEDVMYREGFEKEKRSFRSHLTLGRIKSSKNRDKLEKAASLAEVNPVVSNISKIVLFRSDLTSKGALYTPIETAGFRG